MFDPIDIDREVNARVKVKLQTILKNVEEKTLIARNMVHFQHINDKKGYNKALWTFRTLFEGEIEKEFPKYVSMEQMEFMNTRDKAVDKILKLFPRGYNVHVPTHTIVKVIEQLLIKNY